MPARNIAAVLVLTSFSVFAHAQTSLAGQAPPRSWVDKDTGHRVWRMTDEANSGGFYFNINAYTPDGKQMIYTAPDGIHVLELATQEDEAARAESSASAQAVPAAGHWAAGWCRAWSIRLVAGNKTNSVFYTQLDRRHGVNAVYKADTNTGAIRKLTTWSRRRTRPA